MRRWMLPPPGFSLTTCQCDPRVGGALDVAWKSDEADPAMTLRGKFTEVVLHERAVHTETMALGSGQEIGSLLEKLGIHLFARIEGDHFTILGMPLLPLIAFLRKAGCLVE